MIVIFLIPALFLYALIFLYPVIRTFVMSFFAVEHISQPLSEWAFIGLDNYINLFKKELFVRSVTNYLTIWFVGGVAVLFLAMVYAVILTSGVRLKNFWRSVIYLPNVISAMVLGTMWLQYVFKDNYGLFDKIVALFGGKTPVMWTGPDMALWSLLIAYCFGMVGYIMLTFISGIEKISPEYYESASIEGANIFQKFFRITLPLIKGVIRSNIVVWTVHLGTGIFAWNFMFSPNNLTLPTAVPPVYLYDLVFGGRANAIIPRDTGAGSAVSILMALMVVIVSLITTLITRRDDVEI
ncbi:MAG TPA: sugar ABC transporter permease [Clostridiaceae bacterium]|nr:sugar ABC transporter permease [Clostridiaceae bacterium]